MLNRNITNQSKGEANKLKNIKDIKKSKWN